MTRGIKSFIKKWIRNDDAVAAVESALVFPILLTLLLGTFDMGNAILANQKTIRASQVVGDLVTRTRSIDTAGIDEAITAGQLALAPLDTSSFGVDIVSIRFDDDAQPVIVWRETRGMTPITDVLTRVESLAEAGNGVVVVTVQYIFDPLFSGFVIGEIPMQEIAFTRGRKSAIVNRV